MYRVLLLGAGKIGAAIAKFLTASGEYDVLGAHGNVVKLFSLAYGRVLSQLETPDT